MSQVYPGISSSLFSHSLGAMHISQQAWSAIWGKLSYSERTSFSAEIAAQLDHFRSGVVPVKSDTIVTEWLISRTSKRVRRRGDPNVFLLIQNSLMAATLLKYIGKLPHDRVLDSFYSTSIDELTKSNTDYVSFQRKSKTYIKVGDHDRIIQGYLLTKIDEYYTKELPWSLVCLLSWSDVDTGVIGALKGLVRGDIDGGRIDMLVRNNKLGGTEFGAIDVQRLYESMTILRGEHGWKLGFSSRSQSAIENLVSQRHEYYRWVNYHTHSVAIRTILNYSLIELLRLSKFDQSLLYGLDFSNCTHLVSDTVDCEKSSLVDDNTIDELLKKALTALGDARSPAVPRSQSELNVLALCEAYLYRKRNWAPIWNNSVDFESISEELQSAVTDEIDSYAAALHAKSKIYGDSGIGEVSSLHLKNRIDNEISQLRDSMTGVQIVSNVAQMMLHDLNIAERTRLLKILSEELSAEAKNLLPPILHGCFWLFSYSTVNLWRGAEFDIQIEHDGRLLPRGKSWTATSNVEYAERHRMKLHCFIVSSDNCTRDRGGILHSEHVTTAFITAFPKVIRRYYVERLKQF